MSVSQTFRTAYLRTSATMGEDAFLSVTPNFDRGPGVRRDGLTEPRMRDPHNIAYVCGKALPIDWHELPDTIDPYVQRAGTWTPFHHVRDFCRKHGNEYLVVGVQSCGDLTMNPWHVALFHRNQKTLFCHLSVVTDPPPAFQEPYYQRTYRCLVKWRSAARKGPALSRPRYEFADVRFQHIAPDKYSATLQADDSEERRAVLVRTGAHDVASDIEFALAGKPVVQHRAEIALANIIDRFQDVRHVFNVPTVPASGMYGGVNVGQLNLGEFFLYNDLNVRRAALNSPVIIPLNIPGSGVKVDVQEIQQELKRRHYGVERESPSRRGWYRKYSEDAVEIFYPHNVYPFGMIGGKSDELVSFASGGLSGRVGNTLEGVTRIMHDFFGCEDAMVLDEGYDTFLLVNPVERTKNGTQTYLYDNEQFQLKVAQLSKWLSDEDRAKSADKTKSYALDPEGHGMFAWPLNSAIFDELNEFCKTHNLVGIEPDKLDVVAVPPNRAQTRAVLVLAKKKPEAPSTSGNVAGGSGTPITRRHEGESNDNAAASV